MSTEKYNIEAYGFTLGHGLRSTFQHIYGVHRRAIMTFLLTRLIKFCARAIPKTNDNHNSRNKRLIITKLNEKKKESRIVR